MILKVNAKILAWLLREAFNISVNIVGIHIFFGYIIFIPRSMIGALALLIYFVDFHNNINYDIDYITLCVLKLNDVFKCNVIIYVLKKSFFFIFVNSLLNLQPCSENYI